MEKTDGDGSRRTKRSIAQKTETVAGGSAVTVRPNLDPAYAIVSGIVGVIPASRWTFGRIEPNGDFATIFGSHCDSSDRSGLTDELSRQRMKTPVGPRIAALLGPLEDDCAGVTLLFANERSTLGILVIRRSAEMGAFTSSEISILTFALDAVSEHLSALRLQPQAKDTVLYVETLDRILPAEREGAFYVLDDDLRIVMSWSTADERRISQTGLQLAPAERLPALLEDTVRKMTQNWHDDDMRQPDVARPVSFLVIRTRPMKGRDGSNFIGVRIERYHENNSLTLMAARFQISPREIQVLALLLNGNRLDQIANRLYITSSTVQDHIKSMLDKTESRNRSELIAKVLGWEFPADAAEV